MSTTINKEVVEMDFDARKFQIGVKSTLDSISGLKKSLNFDRQIKNFADLTPAANSVDFTQMGRSIESISNKLSVLGVVGATVIANLTTSLIEGTKSLVNKVLVQPISEGLAEYETQINSIQTILANTSSKGTTLDDVTVALDTLNEFADLTIYNFTQMTDSIGKFTAAGVDLDVSVGAIKGIANLSAVSGATAQQASTAMYQLSQAISTGVVKLQDWNSVVNAGLGGEVFKNALIETARVHDVAIDRLLTSSGGFRNSLQEGWLTSDILLDTLNQFTGDLTDAQLEAMGFTQEQIKGIQEMAQTALGAATDIKTVTQLADTLYEALQSGWSQTWRLIFGDFNEAKELFGAVGDQLGAIIDESADARNKQIQFWARAGGRDTAIQAFMTSMETVLNIMKLVKEGFSEVFTPLDAGSLLAVTNRIAELVEKFKIGEEDGDRFRRIIRGIAAALDIVFLFVKALLSPIKSLIVSLAPAADSFIDLSAGVGDMLFNLRNSLKTTDYFGQQMSVMGERVAEAVQYLLSLKDQFFELEQVQSVLTKIGTLSWDDVREFLDYMFSFLPPIVSALKTFVSILSVWANVLKQVFQKLADLDVVQNFLEKLQTFDGSRLLTFFDNLSLNFSWVKEMFQIMSKGTFNLPSAIVGMGETLAELASGTGGIISDLVGSLIEGVKKVDWIELIRTINAGLVTAILISINSLFGDGDVVGQLVSALFGEDIDFGTAITGALGEVESTLVSFQNNLKADSLLKIAGAISLITASAVTLSLIDPQRLGLAAAALGGMMAALFAGVSSLTAISGVGLAGATLAILGISGALLVITASLAALAAIGPEKATSALLIAGIALTGLVGVLKLISVGPVLKGVLLASGAMVVMSGALIILSGALLAIGSLPYDVVTQGLITIGIALAGMAGFAQIIAGGKLAVAAVGVAVMSAALLVMSAALKSLGGLSWEEMLRGIVAMGAGLLVLAGTLQLFRGVGFAAVNMTIASAALILLADAISTLSGLSWSEVARSLVALGGAMIILVGGLILMQGSLAGAAALVVVSGAVLLLAKAMTELGQLEWSGILKALVSLAGILVLFGIAGLTMGPIIPILLGLGAAMALIGVGALALGAGLLLASLGLTALAASGGAVAGVIIGIIAAIITVLPTMVIALATAITDFIVEMANRTPEIAEAAVTMLGGIVTALVDLIPLVVNGVLQLVTQLLSALLEYGPNIVSTGYELLINLLKGIADNIEEVVALGLEIVVSIIKGLTAGVPDLIDAAFELLLTFINGMADAVDEYYPQIVEAGLRLALAIIEGAVNGLSDGLTMVVNSIIEVAQGMIDAFKEQWGINSPSKVAYDLVVEIANGIRNAFNDKKDSLGRKAKEIANNVINKLKDALRGGIENVKTEARVIGDAIIDGISDRLQAGITSLVNKAISVANAAINGFKQAWGINSPSRVSQELTDNIVYTMVDRFGQRTGALVGSINRMGEKAQNGMGKVMAGLVSVINNSDLNPTIRPVLDSSAVDSGLASLAGRFDNLSVASALSGSINNASSSGTETQAQPVSSETNVTYNQYNTSPKSLSTSDVYRNTAGQLARLKRRAIE